MGELIPLVKSWDENAARALEDDREVVEIDGREIPGGGYIGVNLNRRTKAVFAELTYQNSMRQWLLEPDKNGRIEVADVLLHPNVYVARAVGFTAFRELE